MAEVKKISAGDALKAFKGAAISIRIAKRIKVKGKDGKTRESFETKDVPLAAEHILSAADYGDRIVIATINGRKHETAVRNGAAA